MYTIEEIIEKARKVHGDKYDYSKAVYKKLILPIEIICPEHGSFFQSPHAHLKGQGCPKCGIESRAKKSTKTQEEFIEAAKKIHGDKYDYSKTEYKTSYDKVTIICPKHGEFTMRAGLHIYNKYGCPKCGKEARDKAETLTQDEFLARAIEKHGNKYDYSKAEYVNSTGKVCIICPKHGEFWQRATHHIHGHGCPKCGDEYRGERRIKTKEQFIADARKIHGDKYSYDNVNYENCFKAVKITCPKHGDFLQRPTDHLTGCGCPMCHASESEAEVELREFIASIIGSENVVTSDRKVLEGLEIDIFVPSKKIAFEYDGLYWHNEINKPDKNYHLNKTEICERKGIQLIHIFEDEWLHKKEICKSRIKNLLGLTDRKIFARECSVREIESPVTKKFLEENHLQGSVNGKFMYGLYYNDELISVMTFGNLRKNLGQAKTNGEYELLRFCNKANVLVVGGASKLFSYFVKTVKPNRVISYADRRWSLGNLYEHLGFKLSHTSRPNYFYVIRNERKNRYNYRKDLLVSKYGCSKEETEHEFCKKQGWYRIYDCGSKVYEWKV